MNKHVCIALLVLILLLASCHPAGEAPPELSSAWVLNGNVFITEIPVAYTEYGVQLFRHASYYDSDKCLYMPLEWLAELAWVNAVWDSKQIIIATDEHQLTMELNSGEVEFDGTTVKTLASPVSLDAIPYIPLTKVAELLGWSILDFDGIRQIILPNQGTVLTAEEVTWRYEEIISRWLTVGRDWVLKLIEIIPLDGSTDGFAWFWRSLGGSAYSLCQGCEAYPGMVMVVVDSFTYNNPLFPYEGVPSTGLKLYCDAAYLAHLDGTGSMGGHQLWRFSSKDGADLLINQRIAFYSVADGYLYYTMDAAIGVGTWRMPVTPEHKEEGRPISEIGFENYYWGYVQPEGYKHAPGGGLVASGFYVADNAMFISGVSHGETIWDPQEVAFYRIDLNTMEPMLVFEDAVGYPQLYADWVIYLEMDSMSNDGYPLYRRRLDGSGKEQLVERVNSFYLVGDEIVYDLWDKQEDGLRTYRYSLRGK